jgi:hypothetical protein
MLIYPQQLPSARPGHGLHPPAILLINLPLALTTSFPISPTSTLPPLRRPRHHPSILAHAGPSKIIHQQLLHGCLPPVLHRLLLLPPHNHFPLPHLLNILNLLLQASNHIPLLHSARIPPRPRRSPPSLPTSLSSPLPIGRLVLHALPGQDRDPDSLRDAQGFLRLLRDLRRPLRRRSCCSCRRA